MTDKQYEEFHFFTLELYSSRDGYSRGAIIEKIRDKVREITGH